MISMAGVGHRAWSMPLMRRRFAGVTYCVRVAGGVIVHLAHHAKIYPTGVYVKASDIAADTASWLHAMLALL